MRCYKNLYHIMRELENTHLNDENYEINKSHKLKIQVKF